MQPFGDQVSDMSTLISSELADFISGPVMMVVSTRDQRFRATIGRGTGALYDEATGLIDLFVCRAQWPDVVENAAPGGKIAATFVRPTDYLCYQIKGVIEDITPATEAEAARGQLYVERMLTLMEALEVRRAQLSHSLCARDLMRIGFHPSDVFLQSPGPHAGERLAGVTA
jgi:hypothetical protein